MKNLQVEYLPNLDKVELLLAFHPIRFKTIKPVQTFRVNGIIMCVTPTVDKGGNIVVNSYGVTEVTSGLSVSERGYTPAHTVEKAMSYLKKMLAKYTEEQMRDAIGKGITTFNVYRKRATLSIDEFWLLGYL